MDTSTRLAYERSYLAHERTQMAWVRTTLAFISFGFAIAKLYQLLAESQGEGAPPMGPRTVGMIMIGMGMGSLVVANLHHWRALRALRAECPDLPKSVAGATAILIMVLGLVAFFVALL